MNFICRNIDNASKVKILPSVMFSPRLSKYIDELADVNFVHQDSLAIVLINCVAATLEFSHVLRSNRATKRIPTNLYNLIVARSSYGKSDLTNMLRDMLKMVATLRPTKFHSSAQNIVVDEINPTLDEMSKAGLMSSLHDCCRTLVCDEADMTFADAGLFLTHSSCRTSVEMNCRGIVTSLFDRVCHSYIRQLANRTVSVKRSKLNILGCSTGDIISNIIIRMKSGASFDPTIGRFLFWPLDGPVIPDKLTHRNIDNYMFASLNQFILISSFIENVTFSFDNDAAEKIISWGNSYKTQSYDERNNDECLSARLGKAVQHAYRFAAFLQTMEVTFEICEQFVESYQCFQIDGGVDVDFVDKVSNLFHLKYPDQFRQNEPEPFRISKDVVLRAIDTITGNMHQFLLLFETNNAPKFSSIGRQIIVVSPDQRQPFDDNESTESKKEMKKRQRDTINFKRAAAEMILYPSVCFTLTQLHELSVLHNCGGVPLKTVAKQLTDSDILTVCPRGIKNASKTTPVYIKLLPFEDDTDDESYLVSALSEYIHNDQPISMALYKTSCDSFSLTAAGTISDDVYEILSRPEYSTRSFFPLLSRPNTTSSETRRSSNDRNDATDLAQQGSVIDNDLDEANVLEILSSYIDEKNPSSTANPRKEKETLLHDLQLDHEELHSVFDNIIGHENEINDTNMGNIICQEEDDESNNINTTHTEKHRESNIFINSHKQVKHNTTDTSIPDENNVNESSNIFFSPAAWRTRSKSKIAKEMTQSEGLRNTTDHSVQINHRKRKAKEPKRQVKKSATSKQT